MLLVAARETIVLLIGIFISCLVAVLLGKIANDIFTLGFAILAPMLFCLIRAALVSPAPAHLSWIRRAGYQLAISAALILLLLFEIGVELVATIDKIPVEVGLVVLAMGIGYILFFCLAKKLGGSDAQGELPIS